MEYIAGTTLTQPVQGSGRLSWKHAYELMLPIMKALAQIHRRDIIHRDISPDIIMLSHETNQTVLLDFGAAHVYRGVKGHSYTLRPNYAPVEQYSGISEQDGRTDEYALCATLYFLLTGNKPPESTQIACANIALPSLRSCGADITPALEAVLLKGMSVQMENRYPSMADLITAIGKASVKTDPTRNPHTYIIM